MVFLFLALLFRSAIVGDLAPVANPRRPLPRARLPPSGAAMRARQTPRPAPTASAKRDEFSVARALARKAHPTLDGAFALLAHEDADARVMQSAAMHELVRVYASRVPCCEFEVRHSVLVRAVR